MVVQFFLKYILYGGIIRENLISPVLGDFFDRALYLLGHSATKLIAPLLLRDFFPFFAAFTAFSSVFTTNTDRNVVFFSILASQKGQNDFSLSILSPRVVGGKMCRDISECPAMKPMFYFE